MSFWCFAAEKNSPVELEIMAAVKRAQIFRRIKVPVRYHPDFIDCRIAAVAGSRQHVVPELRLESDDRVHAKIKLKSIFCLNLIELKKDAPQEPHTVRSRWGATILRGKKQNGKLAKKTKKEMTMDRKTELRILF